MATSKTGKARAKASGNGRHEPRSIGNFTTTAPDQAQDNPLAGLFFHLDGQRFDLLGELDLLDKSELAMLTLSAVDVNSPQGIAMVSHFMQLVMGPTEYLKLRSHVKQYRTQDDELLAILAGVGEAVGLYTEEATGRPTGPRGRSSGTPSPKEDQPARSISLARGVTIVEPGGNGTEQTT